MKAKNIYNITRFQINEILRKRKLSSHVHLSKHFVERYIDRRIEPTQMSKCLNYIASNICQIIYSFEVGICPTVEHENLVVKLDYINNKIYLMTCYDKSVRD